MKLKSIALALSFVAVSSIVANEENAVVVVDTTAEVAVEVSAQEVETLKVIKKDAAVSISAQEQTETTEIAPVVKEVAVVPSTEEVAN